VAGQSHQLKVDRAAARAKATPSSPTDAKRARWARVGSCLVKAPVPQHEDNMEIGSCGTKGSYTVLARHDVDRDEALPDCSNADAVYTEQSKDDLFPQFNLCLKKN